MTYREAQEWENEELKEGGELRGSKRTAGLLREGQVPKKGRRNKLEAGQSFSELFRWLEKGWTQYHHLGLSRNQTQRPCSLRPNSQDVHINKLPR